MACLWLIPVVFFGYFTLIDRWDEADRALDALGPGARIVVGVSVQTTVTGPGDAASRSQVYVLLPRSLRTLEAYAVAQTGDQVRVMPIPFGVVIFLGFYLVWIGVSLWYLLTRVWMRA